MNSTQVAVDLAKSVFQVAVSTTPGRIDQHHRLSRERFRRFFAQHESTDVLMEACGTAHHWGRELEALGHRVRLLPPGDVARYRDGNKTDRADAIAILEAMCSPPPPSSPSSVSRTASVPAATSRRSSALRPGRTLRDYAVASAASRRRATPIFACSSSTARAPLCSRGACQRQ